MTLCLKNKQRTGCMHTGYSEPGAGALAQYSLVLLHLWSGTTGTVFLSRIDGYSGAVGPTRPQLEPHLLQAVFFLDQEAPQSTVLYATDDHPGLGLPPVLLKTQVQNRAPMANSLAKEVLDRKWIIPCTFQSLDHADGERTKDSRPQEGCQERKDSKVFQHPPASVYLLF